MSARNAILIFLGSGNQVEQWLRLEEGCVAERGDGLDDLPPLIDSETGKPVTIVGVVPGERVALHWLELPQGLAPAQAAGAARLMAAELAAQPASEMHVAVGPEIEGESFRCVALVAASDMAEWLTALQPAGVDPAIIVPEPLLLLPADDGFVRFDRDRLPLFRGSAAAFSIESELATRILAGAPVATIDAEAFEAGLSEAVERRPVDLRQGGFAKRKRWKIDWKLVRRLALLGLAILLVTLSIQIAAIFRYTFAADEAEQELRQIASTALPGSRITNPERQLAHRLSELQGSGVGYGALASVLFGAVRETPNVELAGIVYDRDGSLRATLRGDSPATISMLEQRIESSGYSAELGPLRSSEGRQTGEMTVRAP